jgi:hypothetical protein
VDWDDLAELSTAPRALERLQGLRARLAELRTQLDQ